MAEQQATKEEFKPETPPKAEQTEKKETEKKETFGDKFQKAMGKVAKGLEDAGKKAEERLEMKGLLKQAKESLEKFFEPEDFEKQIPTKLLSSCEGIVLLTVVKASFGVGASGGTGIALKKLGPDAWSVPCAIGSGGIQWGLNIGAQKTDHIIVLRDEKAMKTLTSKGSISFGGDAAVSAGKYGRNANISVKASDKAYSPIVSYSRSKGVYAGIALEASGIAQRPDCNQEFYDPEKKEKDKEKYSADNLFSGYFKMPKNDDYDAIVKMLNDYIKKAAEQKQKDEEAKLKKDEEQKEKEDDKDKVPKDNAQ